MSARRTLVGVVVACVVGGCGARPSYWDAPVTGTSSLGLARGVALVDNPDHRVVMLSALADQQLAKRSFAIGHNFASAVVSPDGARLFVLSTGDWPPRTKNDQGPSLTVIDASSFDAALLARYEMKIPLTNLAIDPLGHWAVAYVGSGGPASFVENANEILIFDLTKPASSPMPYTIRSFGGTPQRLTFTPELNLPKGRGRLLIIESDIDVTLLELGNSSPPDVTVPLTSGTNGQHVTPAGVVVDDGMDPTNPHDPRIALRASDNRNVFILTLTASDTHDFTPVINLTDVGGVPTDIAFVRVDNGALRIAALVQSTRSAVLVDPATSITAQIALPADYSRLSLITSAGSSTGTDVAMLWGAGSGAASGVAYWTLGSTVGQPYFSVEALSIMRPIQAVDDVAGNDRLKVLETADASGFLVLDLRSRTASPLQTMNKATLVIAPDGLRLWAFAHGGTNLAAIDFATLNPVALSTEAAIDAVFDVARGDGGRSLIAIHTQGPTLGATVFDALNPDVGTARRVPALLLEGP